MRSKLADKREIPKIPLKQISVERAGSPYLSRVEQQHIREGELAGVKSKVVRASPVASGNSGSLAANAGALIELTLTANDANVIVAWPQINIYVDADGGVDNLWFIGNNIVNATNGNLQLGFIQLINTQTNSGLNSNQANVQGILTNRDSSAHTYYIYVRWLYLIVE